MPKTGAAASLAPVTLFDLAQALAAEDIAVRAVAEPLVAVRGMSVDSRAVEPGNLFVCKGRAFKPSYLADAVARGACAYLAEDDEGLRDLVAVAPGVPHLSVHNVRRAMAAVAPVIYHHPDRALTVVGITGTKGKSTVAYMLHAILAAAGVEASVLGSIEADDGIEHFESHNTTPEAPELWRHLRNTVDAGRRTMVMEVSSQGLKYDRVRGLSFDIACFLNIGRDHISALEHPSFEDYFASKLRIFEQCETAVVNLESDRADEILAAAEDGAARVLTLHTVHDAAAPAEGSGGAAGRSAEAPIEGARPADFVAEGLRASEEGIAFTVGERASDGTLARHALTVGVPGFFNVDNALAACAIARLMGVGYDAIARGLSRVRIPGRMELLGSADGHVLALVDYAHNELSFKTLFSSVKRQYPGRRVVAVFGAPGDKAQERRRVLPQVAGAYADLIIYTEEDPAHERVEDICAELAAHTPEGVAYRVMTDREEAVTYALTQALAETQPSIVLLLAKGDETRQHRGDAYPEVKSDLSLARELLQG